jgi:hypothetical protein
MRQLRLFTLVSIAAFLLPCLCPAATVYDKDAGEVTRQNQICVSAGYFVNVHSDFYPVFGSAVVFGAAFYHDFHNAYGYEIRTTARLKLGGNELEPHYISLSPAILATRTIAANTDFRWRIGAGPGLGMRDYSQESVDLRYSWGRHHQLEFSLMAVAETGIDCNVGGFVIKTSVVFERHLTGDPSRGDFGDTGGFTFLLGFGPRF